MIWNLKVSSPRLMPTVSGFALEQSLRQLKMRNFFRTRAGLPALSANAKRAWSRESVPNTRRPITLTPSDGSSPKKQPTTEEE